MNRTGRRYLVILVFLLFGGRPDILCQSTPGNPISTATTAQTDLVHFGDLIDVDVVGSFEFDWRGSLTPEGFLDGFDKIEEQIFALCKDETSLAAEIQKHLSAVLREPKVVVRILDRSNRATAFLDGAVKSPQRFQIRRKVFLNELLIIAGGITENASGEVRIFRPQSLSCDSVRPGDGEFVKANQGNDPQTTVIKIPELLSGRKDANPEILSGDIVTVVEALPIYVIGGVAVPKQISARSQVTLSRAIASAGGIAKHGIENKIFIYRREGTQSRVIEADLKKIREGLAEDPVLNAMDIVEVGQKGHDRGRRSPVVDGRSPERGRLLKLPLRIID